MSHHEEYTPKNDRRSYDPVHSDLEIKEQLEWVDSIISKMNPEDQVMVYGVAEGMSYKELESQLEVKSGTLAVRMKRVREELTAKSCNNKKISSGHVFYSLPPVFGEDNYMCAA
jgi:DNA-directed RNA polymerase specialized sigma24 family protein